MSFKRLGDPFTNYRAPINRSIFRTFIHCDASSNPHTDVMDIHLWHQKRGWSGCGYHIYIDNEGKSWHGRDIEAVGAHTSGYNEGSLGICVNGLRINDFSEAQFKELRRICEEINAAHGGNMKFSEHNDVAAKECPVFNAYAVLGLNAEGFMTESPGEPSAPHTPSEIKMVAVELRLAQVGRGDRHPDVGLIQKVLGITADEMFGPVTEETVKAFQKRRGLTADGIVGPKTYEQLLDLGT
jgi:hypothetical protein